MAYGLILSGYHWNWFKFCILSANTLYSWFIGVEGGQMNFTTHVYIGLATNFTNSVEPAMSH